MASRKELGPLIESSGRRASRPLNVYRAGSAAGSPEKADVLEHQREVAFRDAGGAKRFAASASVSV